MADVYLYRAWEILPENPETKSVDPALWLQIAPVQHIAAWTLGAADINEGSRWLCLSLSTKYEMQSVDLVLCYDVEVHCLA